MEEIINKVVKKAKKDKEIIAVLIFGSYLSGKHFRDIDICLVLKNKKTNLEMSKKRLDYQMISDKLDIQIMQQLPLYIRKEILKNNHPILIKDYDALFEIARKIIREYDYFEKYYLDYLEYIEHGKKAKGIV